MVQEGGGGHKKTREGTIKDSLELLSQEEEIMARAESDCDVPSVFLGREEVVEIPVVVLWLDINW